MNGLYNTSFVEPGYMNSWVSLKDQRSLTTKSKIEIPNNAYLSIEFYSSDVDQIFIELYSDLSQSPNHKYTINTSAKGYYYYNGKPDDDYVNIPERKLLHMYKK